MGIVDRLRQRDGNSADSSFSLTQRLKDLGENNLPGTEEASKQDGDQQSAAASSPSSPEIPAESVERQQEAPADSSRASVATDASQENMGNAPPPLAQSPEPKTPPSQATEKASHSTASDQLSSCSPQAQESAPVNDPQPRHDPQPLSKRLKIPSWKIPGSGSAAETNTSPTSPSPSSKDPVQQLVERLNASTARPEQPAQNSPAAAPDFSWRLRSFQRELEAEFRKRLDGAITEFERRASSQDLIDKLAAQTEQKIRASADEIFAQLQVRLKTTNDAVAQELRAFHDRFTGEIDERAASLDRTTQQGLQLQERIEQSLPKAEDTLRSFASTEEEISSRLQALASGIGDQLRQSHETISRDMDAQKQALEELSHSSLQSGLDLKQKLEEALPKADDVLRLLSATGQEVSASIQALSSSAIEQMQQTHEAFSGRLDTQRQSLESFAGGIHQEASQLSDQIEKFRDESRAATESLHGATDQALNQLAASADQASSLAQGHIQNLLSEAERRILSDDLIGKATSQLAQAAQETVDPSLERLRQVKQETDAATEAAETALHSLSAAEQATERRLQAESLHAIDQLRQSHEEFSINIDAQKQTIDALVQAFSEKGLHLNEQMEKFRGETKTASEMLGHAVDDSVTRLDAAASEAGARAREGIEQLALEVERRILSGGLAEKATAQIAKATQETVEPSLERLRLARQEAESATQSLANTGQKVMEQLDSARQQVESRLDALLAQQLALLESSMSGFQQKAAEELGGVVERVVADSTSQLDHRLHGMLRELSAATSVQINRTARATLSDVHAGLKEALQPRPSAQDGASAAKSEAEIETKSADNPTQK